MYIPSNVLFSNCLTARDEARRACWSSVSSRCALVSRARTASPLCCRLNSARSKFPSSSTFFNTYKTRSTPLYYISSIRYINTCSFSLCLRSSASESRTFDPIVCCASFSSSNAILCEASSLVFTSRASYNMGYHYMHLRTGVCTPGACLCAS